MCNECNKFLYTDQCNCTSTNTSSVHLDEYLVARKDSVFISTEDKVVSDLPCLNAQDTDSLQNKAHINSFLDASSTDFNFSSRGIHMVNLNIRHLKPKWDEMKIILDQQKNIDIFGLCETFLDQTVDNDILSMKGYSFERKDRSECNLLQSEKGGGIMIYIKQDVQFERRNDIESPDIESIWIDIKLKNSKPLSVCSVYRPPSSKAEWFESFSKQIEKALSISDEIYIMGDINVDFKNNDLQNNTWKHVVELHDLQQLITVPTRVTAHSETTIDHVYASNVNFTYDVSVPAIAVSDHYPVCFTRSTSRKQFKRQSHKTIKYRCYSKFNEECFLQDLAREMEATNIPNEMENTNTNFENWTAAFMKIFNNNAPLKSKRVKHETQPEWHSDEIKLARKNRDSSHRAKNWKEYKFWRNKTTSLIRSAKKGFFAKSVNENKNCSYLWIHVKNLKNKSDDRGLPKEIVIDDIKSCDSNDIVNKLNEYFTSISKRLNSEQSQEEIPFDVTRLKYLHCLYVYIVNNVCILALDVVML